jgi:hypothetical protein
MKIILITDQHFGTHNDSLAHLEFQKKFYDEVFFPTVDKVLQDSDTEIIDLGDTFDRRRFIDYSTLMNVKEFYFDKIRDRNLKLHIIVGNHSAYHKSTNSVNSPELALSDYDNIISYKDPTHIQFGSSTYLLMPWINESNKEHCLDVLSDTTSNVLFGHLELTNVLLRGNLTFKEGLSASDLTKFDYVFSGHYHNITTHQNFYYLGAPYQLTWADVDEKKGFYIFDTETLELEFIENPYRIFRKFYWYGEDIELNESDIKNTYINVVVQKKPDIKKFDEFIRQIEDFSPHKLSIQEPLFVVDTDDCSIDEIADTRTFIASQIQSLALEQEKERTLLNFMGEVYSDALTIE